MVYTIQNHRIFGLRPSSEILNTRKHKVSETVSISLHLTIETVRFQNLVFSSIQNSELWTKSGNLGFLKKKDKCYCFRKSTEI
jgi:hypothetical protein